MYASYKWVKAPLKAKIINERQEKSKKSKRIKNKGCFWNAKVFYYAVFVNST